MEQLTQYSALPGDKELARTLMKLNKVDRKRILLRHLKRHHEELTRWPSPPSPSDTEDESPSTPDSAREDNEEFARKYRLGRLVRQLKTAENLQAKRNQRLAPDQRRSSDIWGAHQRTERQRRRTQARKEVEKQRGKVAMPLTLKYKKTESTPVSDMAIHPVESVEKEVRSISVSEMAAVPVRHSGRERKPKKFFDEMWEGQITL